MRAVPLTLPSALFVLADLHVYLLVGGVSIVVVLPNIGHISLLDFLEQSFPNLRKIQKKMGFVFKS